MVTDEAGRNAAIYRANPGYTAVLLDRLDAIDVEALRAGDQGADLYGALVPRTGSGLEMRSLSFETALLFFSLTEPGPLPAFARVRMDADGVGLRRLILDGVLEVARGGSFVSGPASLSPHLTSDPTSAARTAGISTLPGILAPGRPVERDLSTAALQYAQGLVDVPEDDLALRLYCYGRRPLSPHLLRWLPDRDAVEAFLGVGATTRTLAAHGWSTGADQRWHHWFAPGERAAASYKLYVSPLPRASGDALAEVARTAVDEDTLGFKVAADVTGMCRPDRIVVYFRSLDDAARFAQRLRPRLGAMTGCGVPFTAPVTDDGLLSWGADPPPAPGQRGTSWRMWLSRRLAQYLVLARDAQISTPEPWQFAVGRLLLSGIDTTSWTPSAGAWTQVLESA